MNRNASRATIALGVLCIASTALSAAEPQAKVLRAINEVLVPPFAYPSEDYYAPDSRNLTLEKDATTGRYLVTVRLREGTPRIGFADCATEIFEGGFLAGFDYLLDMSQAAGLGGAVWRSQVRGGELLWEYGSGNRMSVGLPVQSMIVEFCAVEDSVLWMEEIGVERMKRARWKSSLAGMAGIDPEFYWMVQMSLRTASDPSADVKRYVQVGPLGSRDYLAGLSNEDCLALAKLEYPAVGDSPKSCLVVERWTLDRQSILPLIRDQSKWTSEAVKSLVKVERVGG